MKELKLNPSLLTSLASGHPWVYRDHVGSFTAASGSWIKVICGSFSAIGLWDAESAIAVRIFSTTGSVDSAWILERVQEAYALREPLRAQGVTGYRLLFGEADNLPGIVVDMYGDTAVLVSYSKSLGALLGPVAEAVKSVSGCRSVVRRLKTEDDIRLVPLAGEPAPHQVIVEERGCRLLAELDKGQKTGLFFDHRENRAFVKSCSQGARVLNLFCYTGGFSVAAGLGGATHVTSVDISRPAVLAAEQNFALNALTHVQHNAIAADVFDYLEQAAKRGELFDIVVCDPPSFAKNRAQLKAAEKAYRRLMSMALMLVRPGGLFCAASCTSQIGPSAFRLALVDAARKAKRRLKIVHDIGQPLDHPVLLPHEEGRYLKFVASRVFPRC